MAGDKTTKRGMGLSEEGMPDSEVTSKERESDVEGIGFRDQTGTRPGLGGQKNAATRPGVGPTSSRPVAKSTYFQDAEPSQPVSRREINDAMGTERGVGNTPPRQISTKPGIAPAPPTSDPPLVYDPEDTPGQPSAVVDELPPQVLRDREQLREDHTPVESEHAPAGEGDRSQFRTAPGGGKNRVSGGRAAAAAYVSPTTVPPGQGTGRITAAVKVHEAVRQDARSFPTEPSLMRRRESSLPPPMPPGYEEPQPSMAKPILLGVAAACVLGALLGWALLAEQESQPAVKLPQQDRQLTEEPKEIGNAVRERPKQEVGGPATTPSAPESTHLKKTKKPAPEVAPSPSTGVSPSAKPQPQAQPQATSGKKPAAKPVPAPAPKKSPSEEDPWLD